MRRELAASLRQRGPPLVSTKRFLSIHRSTAQAHQQILPCRKPLCGAGKANGPFKHCIQVRCGFSPGGRSGCRTYALFATGAVSTVAFLGAGVVGCAAVGAGVPKNAPVAATAEFLCKTCSACLMAACTRNMASSQASRPPASASPSLERLSGCSKRMI